MTHMPGKEIKGEFQDKWIDSSRRCIQCGHLTVKYMPWESSDGGYEDYKFQCSTCKKIWWIDGIDS